MIVDCLVLIFFFNTFEIQSNFDKAKSIQQSSFGAVSGSLGELNYIKYGILNPMYIYQTTHVKFFRVGAAQSKLKMSSVLTIFPTIELNDLWQDNSGDSSRHP